ncbi:MAG TPA: ABC transporter permease, partial [Vicinamibacterales bacterium]|nr:ABC transporter permease [Vicinamibacterales bacterium]
MSMRRLLKRLAALARGRRLDAELDDEILAHLELAEREYRERGLTPDQARRAARLQFGSIAAMKDAHRDDRGVRWLDTLARDARYGLASLLRDPAFTVIAVGVLALGIGANTAMFSVVDAFLLKPLPFPEPDRLARVWEAPRGVARNQTTSQRFLDWQRLNTSFAAMSAEALTSGVAAGSNEPTRISGKLVSANYFAIFRTNALIGRTFLPGEDHPGAPRVAVISHAAWRTRFGSDPNILDRDLLVNGEAHRIIGVLPPGGFDREVAQFWKPLVFTRAEMGGSHWLAVVGRLRDGISLATARENMLAVNASLADVTPQWKKDEGWTVAVDPFDDRLIGGDALRAGIQIGLGAVVLVLLVACANLANLLLARGASRTKEMAIRSALGASRGRLIAQLLIETFVLCAAGTAAGVLVASLLIDAAAPLLPPPMLFNPELVIDRRVLGFAVLVAFLVSLLVGLLPSLQTSAGALTPLLNEGARGSSGSRHRLRRGIVVAEVALSLVLLCGAMLLFKSLLRLQRSDPGVRVENVLTMATGLPLKTYPTPESAARFYDAVIERVQALPGVQAASIAQDLPLQGVSGGEFLTPVNSDARVLVRFKRVDAGYFPALAIPIVSGRGITARDRAGAARIVVINERLAQELSDRFAFADPVGKVVRLPAPYYDGQGADVVDVTIAGVIRNERVRDARTSIEPVAYVPIAQVPRQNVKLIVRTAGEPSAVMPDVRAAIRSIDAALPLDGVRTMKDVAARSHSGATEPAWVIGAFAAVATVLAAFGLYGVLAHAVAQQRREIGIRLALGAQSGEVLSLVLR